MRLKLTACLLLGALYALNGQKKISKEKEFFFSCYLPNGYKCNPEILKLRTMNEIDLKFEEKGRTWFAFTDLDKDATVVFKSFTTEPLYLLLTKNREYSKERISELINSVDSENSSFVYYMGVNVYGHHWGVKSDIQRFIKKKILDQKFLIETLGEPDEIKDSLFGGKPVKCFEYLIEGVRIYFDNDLAIAYEEF